MRGFERYSNSEAPQLCCASESPGGLVKTDHASPASPAPRQLLRMCISDKFQVMLMLLLVQGPQFENHCSNYLKKMI